MILDVWSPSFVSASVWDCVSKLALHRTQQQWLFHSMFPPLYDFTVSGGGLQAKETPHNVFGQKYGTWRSSSREVNLEVAVFSSLLQVTFVENNVECPLMTRRIPEIVGNGGDGFRIDTMMLNFHILIAAEKMCISGPCYIWSTRNLFVSPLHFWDLFCYKGVANYLATSSRFNSNCAWYYGCAVVF